MILESEYYSVVWSYLFAILACVLACLAWLYFGRNRTSNDIQNPSKHESSENLGNETNLSTKVESKEEICTSLSCIRCSNSVYSVEKLLKKWNTIKQRVPDQNTRNRIRDGISNTSQWLQRSQQEPTLFHLEGLPSQIWYTSRDYSNEVSLLQKQSTLDIFLKEFTNVYKNLDVGWVSNKVPSGGWYLFYLINQGVKIQENCTKCPKVIKMVEGLKSAMFDCAFGNVVFSVLLPGTRIGRHCGPTNVRIRCHVPLRAPAGYFISVAREQRTWRHGEVLIFDDSFYHEVYCNGDINEPRVVLMIDLWHPSLSSEEQEIIKQLFSPQH